MQQEEQEAAQVSLGRRVVVMVIFISSLSMCSYQTYGLVLLYLGNPIETEIKVTVNDVMRFPAVTVCNLNPVRRSKWKNVNKNGTIVGTSVTRERRARLFGNNQKQNTVDSVIRDKNNEYDTTNEDNEQVRSTIYQKRVKRKGSSANKKWSELKATVEENTMTIASLNQSVQRLQEQLTLNKTAVTNVTVDLSDIHGNISMLWDSLNNSLSTVNELQAQTNELSARLSLAELTTSEIAEEMVNTKSYLNYLRTNMSKVAHVDVTKNETLSKEEETEEKELPPSKDMEAFNNYLKNIGLMTKNDIQTLGHQKKDFIAICSWKGSICESSHFAEFQNYIYGNCFTFNTSQVNAYVRGTGPRNGLSLSLFIEQNEYIDRVAPAAGARIVIHDFNYKPFPEEEGFSVAPGYTTAVFLRKSTTETVKPMCNPDTGTLHEQNGTKYSQKACNKKCLSDAILRDCNCTSTELLMGTNTCTYDNQEQAQCIRILEDLSQNDQLSCSCPVSCRTTTYMPMISSAIWPAEKYFPSLLEELVRVEHKVLDVFENITDFAQYFREHFLRIDIFFQELTEQEIIQRHSYGIENLLSDIGGQLGLWIGVSVATLAESVETIVAIVTPMVRRFRLWRRTKTYYFY